MFDAFLGNARVVADLRRLLGEQRLPQTILFAGPAGVGKATLARLVAASLNCASAGADPCGGCSACRRIQQSDLWLEPHRALIEERTRLAPEKRRDNPLVISTHPEFLIFPPDGPLEQVSIEQVRRLKNLSQFGPSEGRRRLFLIDRADRMDPPAANSLLKVLEEPPPYLTLIVTAENAYDLLPTIRSRAVPFYFAPLTRPEMERFMDDRKGETAERARRIAWAQGSPGRALAMDVAGYDRRRRAMLALLEAALGSSFAELLPYTEPIGRSKQEKLEAQIEVLYELLRDLARARESAAAELIHEDLRPALEAMAKRVDFDWLWRALEQVDALDALGRRNIQKQIALEALAVALRPAGRPLSMAGN